MRNHKKIIQDAHKKNERGKSILTFIATWLATSFSIYDIEGNMNCLSSIMWGFVATGGIYSLAYLINLVVEFLFNIRKGLMWIVIILGFLGLITYYIFSQNKKPIKPPQTAPMIISFEDLPICISKDENFPCRHLTIEKEFPRDIADYYYNNRTELSGRIMELYRDESGTIPVFKENEWIIIPEVNREQDLVYYKFYFQLLDPPILQCPYITPPPTPCWHISKGESYKELASHYYPPVDDTCIRAANKTKWNGTDLVPKTIEFGTMIMLPVCP